MKKIAGLVFALLVLLSGATLVPAVGLPQQGFSWQLYANVYDVFQLFMPLIGR